MLSKAQLSKEVDRECSGRFAALGDEEMKEMLEKKHAQNTITATKSAVTCLRAYLQEKKQSTDFENLPKDQLASVLRRFYVEARKLNGDEYKRNALISIRSGINRHLLSVSANIDIVNDPAFTDANEMFVAQKVHLKRVGKGQVEHHPEISEEDMTLLYQGDTFSPTTPQTLQWKVFFEMMLYICRRGRENLRDLTPGHFAVSSDATGRQFLYQAKDEMRKNRRDDDDCRSDGGRIYAIEGSPLCPVKSYLKYVSKLNPACNFLFQRPKAKLSVTEADPVWYDSVPVGKCKLGTMMADISDHANLPTR